MSTATASRVAWWVVCDDYRAGPFSTVDAARRSEAGVVGVGSCHLPHRVVSGPRVKP